MPTYSTAPTEQTFGVNEVTVTGVVPVEVSSKWAPMELLIAIFSGDPSTLYGVVQVPLRATAVRLQVKVLDVDALA